MQVPGKVYGTSSVIAGYETHSSFLPFKLKNNKHFQKDPFSALETIDDAKHERRALGDEEGREFERRFPEEKAHL